MEHKAKPKIINQNINNQYTDITYPQFQLEDEVIAKKINEQILELVLEFINFEDLYLQSNDLLYGNYKIEVNQNDLISLTIEFCSYKDESDISFTTLKSLTIDTATGFTYTLKDLFCEGSDYESVINQKVLESIRDNSIPIIEEFGNMGKYRGFYLTKDCLVIYYNLNRNSRYASSYYFPRFKIPYNIIKENIDPKGPLTKLM